LQNVYFRLSEVAISSKRFAKMQLPICPVFHKSPQSCSDSFPHMTYVFQLQTCLDLRAPLQPPICKLCCPNTKILCVTNTSDMKRITNKQLLFHPLFFQSSFYTYAQWFVLCNKQNKTLSLFLHVKLLLCQRK